MAAIEEPRDMDRPMQRVECSSEQEWPYRFGLTAFLGMSSLLLVAGCAQIDQMLGNPATSAESQPAVQDKDSVEKQTTKKKTTDSPPPGVVKEPSHRAPSSTAAAGTTKQTDQEKALAEKKEKKSRVASDKKSTKKLPQSQAEPQPPPEDVFLSPVPLPSKPAAIGGSGG